MEYLFLMFLRYYRGGKSTKSIAYFSALTAVVMCIYILIFCIISLLGLKFLIRGIDKIPDYMVVGFIMIPIYLYVYYIFPPQKVKKIYRRFSNNKIKNIIIITILIIMFITIFIE